MTQSKFKILVGIYLNGNSLDPVMLSSLLGVSPSSSKRKGDRRVTSTGNEVVAKMGQWALVVEVDSDTLDLSKIVSELGDRIGNSAGRLDRLPGVDNGYVDVFAATTADAAAGATCEFELNNENIGLLQSFGLPIRFTVGVSQPNPNRNDSKT